jgi:hypothetical protein
MTEDEAQKLPFQHKYRPIKVPGGEWRIMWAVRGLPLGKYNYEPTFRTCGEAKAFCAGAQGGTLHRVPRWFPDSRGYDDHNAKMRAADTMLEALRPRGEVGEP